MRILIDLLDGLDGIDSAALGCLQLLVRSAGAEDIRLAVPDDPAAYEAVETAFSGLLPRARARPFALVGDAPLRALLRRHALASLAPDVVLVPAAISASASVSTSASLAAPDPALPIVVLDPTTDTATLLARLAASAAERLPPLAPAAKPRLAYVSPLPPQRSGIADYSAELAPQLARHYALELIVDQHQVADARLDGLPLRSVDWFRRHAQDYERVLYHVGNSPLHRHMFELIRAVPGVVVLHDFFVGNVLDHLERQGALAQGFLHGLYESHGYTGLLGLRRSGRNAAAWAWPVNKGILDHAAGIIVHAEYPKQLARDWYGPDAADGWRSIPLLRGKPAGHGACPDPRAAARARLGIGLDDFIVCSFGMLGPTKLNQELAAAFLASPLAQASSRQASSREAARCTLVFVGENDPGRYGAELLAAVRGASARITGFVDGGAYADWLAACDLAVQLRRASRGETSAAVLDCLLYGVPTVVNAHGAVAALPDDVVLKLPDLFDTAALAGALARLRLDAALRAKLSRRAAAYMAAGHAPEHAAQTCFEAIEHFARHGEHAAYRALVDDAAALCLETALPALAGAIAFNRAVAAPRQLLVDVSALLLDDLKTGIQRVVRNILLALIAEPPPGYRVEPVFTEGGNRGYRYARGFGMRLVGGGGENTGLVLEDAPAELRPGDIFFGLDLYLSGTAQNEAALLAMRARGVAIYFCIYDLLPLLRPAAFPFGTDRHFGAFLRTVQRVADGVLCISRAVADELAEVLAGRIDGQDLSQAQAPPHAQRPLQVGWFHLGADIDAGISGHHHGHGPPSDAAPALQALAALDARPSFLMVGTVEPRKGHAQALAAFELLWEQGVNANLVVVGKQGWMVEQLARRLRDHTERDARLFWLAGIPDAMLLDLYAGASALLAPSEGEGFGLPLIEAARHGLPIVARGLPVFREVAGGHAHYFEGSGADDLARALAHWLRLWRAGQAPASGGMPWQTWQDSARQALQAIVGGKWYRTI